jgi:hypothetical protein
MDSYDLIVIGTGTAAQVVSSRVRRAGRSVAVIDHRPFGGTCALRGCDPRARGWLGMKDRFGWPIRLPVLFDNLIGLRVDLVFFGLRHLPRLDGLTGARLRVSRMALVRHGISSLTWFAERLVGQFLLVYLCRA